MERRSILKGLGLALVTPLEVVRDVAENADLQARLDTLAQNGPMLWNQWTRFIKRSEDYYEERYILALRIKDESRNICPHEWGQIPDWNSFYFEGGEEGLRGYPSQTIWGCQLCGSQGEDTHVWKNASGIEPCPDFDDKPTMLRINRIVAEGLLESVPAYLERYLV